MKWLAVAAVLCVGCTAFRAKPVIPAQTAAALEARRLDHPGLRPFLETNLHRKLTHWPPEMWDFPMLTLAALFYHPDLNVGLAQWEIAQAGTITAGQRPNPSVAYTPGYVNIAVPSSGEVPWLHGLTFNIPIETAGKRGYRLVQAQHLSEAARQHVATLAWQVRSRLRTGFLNLYAAIRTESALNRQQVLQEAILERLERRLAVGEIPRPEVTQARITLDQSRLAVREAQKQKAENRVQLAEALGLPVDALDERSFSFSLFERFPSGDKLPLPELRRSALFNRPDILGALADYAASESSLQLEIAKQYPDINLGPGYKFDKGDHQWSLGISLTVPVFNRNEGPIAQAEARRKEAAASFNALQARIIGEIDRAFRGYQAALEKLATADDLVAIHKNRQQSVQAMLKAGEADRLDLLSVQLERISIETARIEALIKVQQSLGALEDALHRPLDGSAPWPVLSENYPPMSPRDKQ